MKYSHSQKPHQPWLKSFARAFILLFAVQTALGTAPAYAQIVASPTAGAGAKPIPDQARNGAGIVHIAPASAGGISHNQYEQFNIGPNGLILNNSAQNLSTTLGGWIVGNPQLGATGQPARIILNEVTSANPSALRGTIEVGGQRADIIIANPNGIQCDGCGFLNAGRATLTTGSTQLNSDGSVRGFGIERGTISVGPGGLDARSLEQLDLLARGIVIEGTIAADRINAIAGANQVLYGDVTAVTSQAGTGEAPKFAIDIRNVGGMYANQVYMVATDKGVGVNSSGRLAAREGLLTLSADGDLRVADTYGKQGVQLASAAGRAEVSGKVFSEKDIKITSKREVLNEGALHSGERLMLDAPVIENKGTMRQDSASEALVLAPSDRLSNSGQIYSSSSLDITTRMLSGAGDADTSRISSAQDLSIQADTVALAKQSLASSQAVRVRGNDISFSSGKVLGVGDIKLRASGTLDLSASQVQSNTKIDAQADAVRLSGADARSVGNITIHGKSEIDAQGAAVQAGTEVNMRAAQVSTRDATIASEQINIGSTDQRLDNTGGKLLGYSALNVTGMGIDNPRGAMQSDGIMSINASDGAMRNDSGTVSAPSVNLSGVSQLSNRGGHLTTQGELSLAGALDNQGGKLATKTLSLSGSLDNQGGTLSATESILIRTGGGALNNQQGKISANDRVDIATSSGHLGNQDGAIYAGRTLALDSGVLDNAAGHISTVGEARVSASSIRTSEGTLAAGAGLQIDTGTLDARQARIGSESGLRLNVNGDATLDGATLSARDNIAVHAQAIHAQGATTTSGANLSIRSQSLEGGDWSAKESAHLSTQGLLDITGGSLLVGKSLVVSGNGITTNGAKVAGMHVSLDAGQGELSNTGGQISAAGMDAAALTIRAQSVENQNGIITSTGGASVEAKGGGLNNRGGTLATKDLSLNGALDNQGGTLSATDSLSVRTNGGALNNQQGSISAKGSVDIATAGGQLSNQGGAIHAGQALALEAGALNNAAGTIDTAGAASLQAARIDTSGGTIVAGARLQIDAEALDASQARIGAGTDLDLNLIADANLDGATLSAKDKLELNAQAIRAQGTVTRAGADLKLNGSSLTGGTWSAKESATVIMQGPLDISGGMLLGGDRLLVNANGITTDGAKVGATHVSLDAGERALSNIGGQISAIGTEGTALSIVAQGVINHKGVITSAGAASIDVKDAVLDNREGTLSTKDLSLTGTLDNRGGKLIAEDVNLSGDLENRGGTLDIKDLDVNGALDNQSGKLIATGSLKVRTDGAEFNNQQGHISVKEVVDIETSGGQLNNQDGFIHGGQSLAIDAGELNNAAGTIETRGAATVRATTLSTSAGNVIAVADLRIDADVLNANQARIGSDADLTLNVIGGAHLNGAKLSSQQELNLTAGTIHAQGATTIAGGNLNLTGESLSGGIWSAKDNATVAIQGALDISGGELRAGSDLIVSANGINADGAFVKGTQVSLDAGWSTLSNVDGKILATGTQDGALAVVARGVNNRAGTIVSAGNARIDSKDDVLDNRGGTLAAKDLNVSGALNNQLGTVFSEGSLNVRTGGGELNNQQGTITVKDDLDISTSGGELSNQGGSIHATRSLALDTGKLNNAAGTIDTPGAATIRATSINSSSGTVAAGAALQIDADTLEASKGRIGAGTDLSLKLTGDAELDSATLSATNKIDLNAQAIRAQGATTIAGGNLNLTGESLSGGIWSAKDNATVAIQGALDISGGELRAGSDLIVSANGINADGAFVEGTQVFLDAGWSTLSNVGGKISATGTEEGALAIVARGVNNKAGTIVSAGDADINVKDGILDNRGGTLGAKDLSVSGALNNQLGMVSATGSLNVRTGGGELNNQQGTITVQDDLDIATSGGELSNQGGSIHATRSLALDTGVLNNADGTIDTPGAATVQATRINTSGGTIAAGTDLQIDADTLEAIKGRIGAGTDLTLNLTGDAQLDGATLSATQKINLGAKAITAQAAITTAGEDLTLTGQSLRGGSWSATQSATVSMQGPLDISGGKLWAGTTLDINGHGITTDRAVVQGEQLQIDAGEGALSNIGGKITALGTHADALSIQAAGVYNQREGNIASAGGASIDLKGKALDNRLGTVKADGDVDVKNGALSNQGGLISSRAKLTFDGYAVDNQGGRLQSVNKLSIDTHGERLNTSDGVLLSEQNVDINAGELTGSNAELDAGFDLKMRVTHMDAKRIRVTSGTSTDVQVSGAVLADESKWLAQDSLNVSGASIEAAQASFISNELVSLVAKDELNLTGALASVGGSRAKEIKLEGREVTASGLRAETDGSLTIRSENNLELTWSQLQAGKDIDLGAVHELALQGATAKSTAGLKATAHTIAAAGARLSARESFDATATGGKLDLDNSQTLAGGNMSFAGQTGVQARNAVAGAVGRVSISSSAGDLDAQGATVQSQSAGVSVRARSIDLRATPREPDQPAPGVLATADVQLNATHDVQLDGIRLVSDQAVGIRTKGAVSTVGATVFAGTDASIYGSTLNNERGRIDAPGSLEIALSGDSINNHQGRLSGQSNLSMTSSSDSGRFAHIDNSAGLIQTQGALSLAVEYLNNRAGEMLGEQSLTLVGGPIDSSDGKLGSKGDVRLDTLGAAFTADRVRVTTENGSIDLSAGDLSLAGSAVKAGQSIDVRGTAVNAHGMELGAPSGHVTLDVGRGRAELEHVRISSGSDIRLTTGQTNLSQADVSALGHIDARTSSLRAEDSKWRAERSLSVTADEGAVAGAGGRWVADESLGLQAASGIDLSRGFVMGERVALDAGAGLLNNSKGSITSSGAAFSIPEEDGLVLFGQGVDNLEGRIESVSGVQVDAGTGTLNNERGTFKAVDAMKLRSQGLNNLGGTAVSNGDLTVSARQGGDDALTAQLDNTGGTLHSARGSLRVEAGTILNPAGEKPSVMGAGSDVVLNSSGSIINRGNTILAGRDLGANAAQAIVNASGKLLGLRNASVEGASINNAHGRIASNARTDITAHEGDIDNSSGVATAKDGLNVKSAGDFHSNHGALHAGSSLELKTEAMHFNHGTLTSQADASLKVTSIDANDSNIASGKELHVNAGTGSVQLDRAVLSSVSTLDIKGGATFMRNAALESGGDQKITVQSLTAPNANLNSQANLTVDSSTTADLASSDLGATTDLKVSAIDVNLRKATVDTGRDTHVTAQNIDAHQSHITTTRDVSLIAEQALDFGGSTVNSGQDLRVSATRDTVSSGAKFDAGRDLDVNVSGLLKVGEADSHYHSGRDLTLRADSIDVSGQKLNARNLTVEARTGELNNESGSLTAVEKLVANGQGVRNHKGTFAANHSVQVGAGKGILNNRSGVIRSNETSINVDGARIENQGGRLSGSTRVGISGGSLDNQGGTVFSNEDLQVQLAGYLNNSEGGSILAHGAIAAVVSAAQGIDNQGGTISTQQSLNVDAGSGDLKNSGGTIQSLSDLRVAGKDVTNRDGKIIGRESLSAHASGTLDHAAGAIMGSELGAISITAGTLDNTGNTLHSVTDLTVKAGRILNRSGTMASTDELSLTLQGGELDNQKGVVAGKVLLIDGTGSVQNQDGVISGSNKATLTSGAVNNSGGVIEAGKGGIRIDTRGQELTNTDSGAKRGVVSEGDVDIKTRSLNNTSGYAGSNGKLTINADDYIKNKEGTLFSQAAGSVTAKGALDNTSGSVTSAADLSVVVGTLTNTGTGTVYGVGDLTVNADIIDNSGTDDGSFRYGLLSDSKLKISVKTLTNIGGAAVSMSDLTLTADELVNNQDGKIAGRNVTSNTPKFINTGGRIDANKKLIFDATDFSADGALASGDGIKLSTVGDYTHRGSMVTYGDLELHTTGVYTNLGTLSTTQHLGLRAHGFNNEVGAVFVAASTSIAVDDTVNNAGLINASSGSNVITAQTVNNLAGGRAYGDSVAITAAQINNESTATVASRRGDLTLTGSVSNAPDSLLMSMDNVQVNGSLRNVGGRVDARRNIGVTGEVRNENAGLQIEQQSTRTAFDSVKTFYASTTHPGARYAKEDVRFDESFDSKPLVLPSTTYPFERFGAGRYKPVYVVPCFDCDDPRTPHYADNDSVWSTFEVPRPDFSDLSAPSLPRSGPHAGSGCIASDGDRSELGGCPAYWASKDAYDAEVARRRSIQLAKLQTELDAFNNDLASRRFADYFVTNITDQEVTQDVVVSSAPGQISAGDSIGFGGGGINKDSRVIANREFVSNHGLQNLASKGRRTTVDHGHFYMSRSRDCGTLGTRTCRDNDPAQPIAAIATASEFDLDIQRAVPANPSAPHNQKPEPGIAPKPYAVAAVLGGTRPRLKQVEPSGTAVGNGPADGGTNRTPVVHSPQSGTPTHGPDLKPIASPSGDTAGIALTESAPVEVTKEGQAHVTLPARSNVNVAPTPEQPLRGSVIAERVRAGQSQVIETAKAKFIQSAAARPISIIPVRPSGAFKPSAHPSAAPGGGLPAVDANGLVRQRDPDQSDPNNLDAPPIAEIPKISVRNGEYSTDVEGAQAPDALNAPHSAHPKPKAIDDYPTAAASGQVQIPEGVPLSLGDQPMTEGRPAPIRGEGYTTAAFDGQLNVPGSALFNLNGEPGANYLVETDPAFTDRQNFISSDYYLNRLGLEGAHLHKRYGDGFAEAQLIDDQIMSLTGRRIISDYSDSQSQFQGLMDAGVTVTEQFQLTPGVGLSAAQMQQLTSDVMLLVKDTVTLSDGSTTEALVPKVYMRRPLSGDITPAGSLIAASDYTIRAPGEDIVNSGTLYAHGGNAGTAGVGQVSGQNVINSGTTDSDRAGVLRAVAAGRGLLELGQRMGVGMETGGKPGAGDQQGFSGGIRLGIESNRSESSYASHSESVQNSVITGGGQTTLAADLHSGSLKTRAATVQGKDVVLEAHTIDLGAQEAHSSSSTRNQSSGFTAGVTYNGGWSFDASASTSQDKADNQSTQRVLTHIRATDEASFTSTADTSLRGARVEGDSVKGRVGGDLTIESVQDTAIAKAEQSSSGVNLGYGASGSGSYQGTNAGLSISVGQANGSYAMVSEQSGIHAGQGGFDVDVAGTTRLKGGALDSLASADKNNLTTGRLETEDIANHSEFNSSTFGVSLTVSGQ